MKKALKITGIVIGIILVVMICIPFVFSDKIEGMLKKEANKMIDADFDFASLDISLLKNFPKASLSLKDFWVKGQGPFSADTLTFVSELTVTVDVLSLFKDEGFEVDQILLKDAQVHAKVLADGQENWNILKEDTQDQKEENEAKENSQEVSESDFSLKLKKLSIKNLELRYENQKESHLATIDQLSLDLKGNLASKHTQLVITGQTPNLSFKSGGIALLDAVALKLKLNLDADLENNIFTLEKNELQLNAIKTSLDGWVALKDDASTEMDLKLNTNDIGFKEILSLIPAIYSTNFKDLKTAGTAQLTAYVSGTLGEDKVPSFKVALQVKDAQFRYTSLPSGVDQIQIHASIQNPGGSLDLTTIQLDPLSFSLANNPFKLSANIAQPISNPHFDIQAQGLLDLGKIKEVYPLENTDLNGLIDVNISIDGQTSAIENEQYEQIHSSGTIQLSDMRVERKDLPKVNIEQSLFTFTPRFLKLSETSIHIGDNDLTLNSQLNNYLAYLLKGSTLQASLNLQSNYLNLNDFSTTSSEELTSETPTDSIWGVIEVPKNIDFSMNANLKKVVLGTLNLEDMNGHIHIKDGKAAMTNLSMKAMDGKVLMNGYYSTQKLEQPTIHANFELQQLTFAQTYKDLNMVQQLAPIFNSLEGNFSGAMQIHTELNEGMEPIYSSLQATGKLTTQDLSLTKVEVVQQLAKALKQEELVNKPIKDMELSFEIEDGRLHTNPFDLKMGDYKLSLEGTTGLDQTIDYTGRLTLPASLAQVEGLNTLGFLIEGSFTSPTFKVDTKSMLKEGAKVFEDKATELLQKELLKHKKDSTAVNDTVQKEFKEQVKDAATDKLKDLFKKKKNK